LPESTLVHGSLPSVSYSETVLLGQQKWLWGRGKLVAVVAASVGRVASADTVPAAWSAVVLVAALQDAVRVVVAVGIVPLDYQIAEAVVLP